MAAHRREFVFILLLVACSADGPADQVNWAPVAASSFGGSGTPFPAGFGGGSSDGGSDGFGGDGSVGGDSGVGPIGTGGATAGPTGAGGSPAAAGPVGAGPVGAGPGTGGSPAAAGPVGAGPVGTGGNTAGPGTGGSPAAAGPGPVGTGGSPAAAGPGPVGAGGSGAGPTGAGGDPTGAGPTGGGGTTIASTTGPCLTVSFSLTDDGGQFGPRNIGAIWVTTASGTYIRTLDVWANKRAKYLSKWIAASGGDKVDAVTSATMNSLGNRSATWDCTDKSGALVPEGDYQIHAEMTEDDGTGPSTVMTASLHPGMPFDQQLGTAQNFNNRHLVHPP